MELDRILTDELHYEDLLRHAQRLLLVDEVANLYRQHYGAGLADEFQDLSPQRLAIALATCTSSRTFVGDPLQGIYSWPGAEPAKVEAELREICGDPIPLTVWYRSSPSVLAMLNGVSGRLGGGELRAASPEDWLGGGAASVFKLPTTADEASFIAAVSEQIVKADPTASVGAIARSGWRRKEIDQAFAAMSDVPCRRWDLAIEDPVILDRLRAAVAGMPKGISFEDALARVLATIDPSDVDTLEQGEDAFGQLEAVGAAGVRAALQQFRVREADAPSSQAFIS